MVRAYFWWYLWVYMGRLRRMLARVDAWVRWQYAGALTKEVMRRQRQGA